MAAISVTASQVLAGTGDDASFSQGVASATITAGQALYAHTDGTIKGAITTTAATAACLGIALHAALSGQPIRYQTAGNITIGAAATMTVGESYFVDIAAGGISPAADVGTGEFSTFIGTAVTAAILKIRILASGVAHA
jgi:hypothetical protein